MRSTYKSIVNLLPQKKMKILDVGCGKKMLLSKILTKMGHDVYGCDPLIKKQNKRFKKAIAENLPYPNKSFDSVILCQVIEHTENPFHAVREAIRVLRKDGYLIISMPNVASLFSRIYFLLTGKLIHFREHEYKKIGHITIVPLWKLERILTKNDFEIIKTVPTTSRIPKMNIKIPNSMFFAIASTSLCRKKGIYPIT